MRMLLAVVLVALAGAVEAQVSITVGPQGQYLGNLSANRLDTDSVSNPLGRSESPLSPDSINNPDGALGIILELVLGDESIPDARAPRDAAVPAHDAAGVVRAPVPSARARSRAFGTRMLPRRSRPRELWRNRTFALGAYTRWSGFGGCVSFLRERAVHASRSGTTTYRTTRSSGARAETDAYGFPSADEVLFASNTQPPPLSCMTRRPRDRATASNLSESRAGCVTKRIREP